jgi:hypothetical protein
VYAQGSVTGDLHAFLSIDKGFAGAWKCPSTMTDFIADCSFSAWHH